VPKVNGQFPSGLIALRGILFKTLGDNTFEFEGQLWIELAQRNRRAMEYGVEQQTTGEFDERALARSHFIENEAGGVKISASIEFPAQKLFGSHVGKRSGYGVRFELRLRGRFGEGQAQLGETEIQNLEATVVGDEEIGGLQIAMNNRVIVGSDESRDKLKGEIEEFGFREGTGGELDAERTARNVFHHQEIGASLSIEIVDGGDIGMIEL